MQMVRQFFDGKEFHLVYIKVSSHTNSDVKERALRRSLPHILNRKPAACERAGKSIIKARNEVAGRGTATGPPPAGSLYRSLQTLSQGRSSHPRRRGHKAQAVSVATAAQLSAAIRRRHRLLSTADCEQIDSDSPPVETRLT